MSDSPPVSEDVLELLERISDIKAGQLEERSIDDQLDTIEKYAEKFAVWFQSYGEQISATAQSGQSQPELEQLLADHAQISEYARELLEKTDTERRAVQQKGKGIMAYLDILPKRLSVTRSRKG